MKKNLNIEISVRRMAAQNILTASIGNIDPDSSDIQLAPGRFVGGYDGDLDFGMLSH